MSSGTTTVICSSTRSPSGPAARARRSPRRPAATGRLPHEADVHCAVVGEEDEDHSQRPRRSGRRAPRGPGQGDGAQSGQRRVEGHRVAEHARGCRTTWPRTRRRLARGPGRGGRAAPAMGAPAATAAAPTQRSAGPRASRRGGRGPRSRAIPESAAETRALDTARVPDLTLECGEERDRMRVEDPTRIGTTRRGRRRASGP